MTAERDSWRVGVLGLGWVAQRVHLPYLRASRWVTLAGVCDIDPAAARKVSHTYGVRAYESSNQLLSSAIDVLFICTPPGNHVPSALEALERGIHVVCEKPLAIDAQDAHRVADLANVRGLCLFCCLTARYREDVSRMRREVLAGTIGEPRYLRASWLRSQGIPSSRGALDSGVLWDLGTHLVDLALWLTGWRSPRVVGASAFRVSPEPSRDTASWHGDMQRLVLDPKSADTAVIDLALDGNAGAHIEVSWAAHTPQDRTEVLLIGTRAALRLHSVFGWSPARTTVPDPALVVSDLRTGGWRPLIGPQDRAQAEYRAQLDDVFLALRAGQLRRDELRVAVETTEVLAAASQALRSREQEDQLLPRATLVSAR